MKISGAEQHLGAGGGRQLLQRRRDTIEHPELRQYWFRAGRRPVQAPTEILGDAGQVFDAAIHIAQCAGCRINGGIVKVFVGNNAGNFPAGIHPGDRNPHVTTHGATGSQGGGNSYFAWCGWVSALGKRIPFGVRRGGPWCFGNAQFPVLFRRQA